MRDFLRLLFFLAAVIAVFQLLDGIAINHWYNNAGPALALVGLIASLVMLWKGTSKAFIVLGVFLTLGEFWSAGAEAATLLFAEPVVESPHKASTLLVSQTELEAIIESARNGQRSKTEKAWSLPRRYHRVKHWMDRG